MTEDDKFKNYLTFDLSEVTEQDAVERYQTASFNDVMDAFEEREESELLDHQRELYKTRQAFEQFAKDIAYKLGIEYLPPVSKGECVYLEGIEALKEEIATLKDEADHYRKRAEERAATFEKELAEATSNTAASIDATLRAMEGWRREQAKGAKLEGALKVLADETNWDMPPDRTWLGDDDPIAIAQSALEPARQAEGEGGGQVNVCAICGREACENEAMCALFWNLELNNDYEPEDAIDPYEQYEAD